jgi:hypothetical protein
MKLRTSAPEGLVGAEPGVFLAPRAQAEEASGNIIGSGTQLRELSRSDERQTRMVNGEVGVRALIAADGVRWNVGL